MFERGESLEPQDRLLRECAEEGWLVCATCGANYRPDDCPEICPICADERQFVPPEGQRWISLSDMLRTHRIAWKSETRDLHALGVAPSFAIGQRAFVLQAGDGNILWDCLPMLDHEVLARLRVMGPITAIAISHPHFHGAHAVWSKVLGDVPVYVHADDACWLQSDYPALHLWDGEQQRIGADVTLIRCGGHFAGSAVLHWASGDGHLLTGDTMQVVADRAHVSFMRSYPNLIPLGPSGIERIRAAIEPFRFASVHGAFPGRTIEGDGKAAVERSVARYLSAIAH